MIKLTTLVKIYLQTLRFLKSASNYGIYAMITEISAWHYITQAIEVKRPTVNIQLIKLHHRITIFSYTEGRRRFPTLET